MSNWSKAERVHEIWNDAEGDHYEVGKDRRKHEFAADWVEIRSYGHAREPDARFYMPVEVAVEVARVITAEYASAPESTAQGTAEATPESPVRSCQTCTRPRLSPWAATREDALVPCGLPCTGFDLWQGIASEPKEDEELLNREPFLNRPEAPAPKENQEYLKGLLVVTQDWARWFRDENATSGDRDTADNRLLEYLDGMP